MWLRANWKDLEKFIIEGWMCKTEKVIIATNMLWLDFYRLADSFYCGWG